MKTAPTLGNYAILKEIFQDAFGVLYSAQDIENQGEVWIRAISPEIANNDNFIIRFELLKSLLPAIEHPNLVPVTEIACENNIYFIVYKPPEGAETLEIFDVRNIPNRTLALEQLFHGIASGLNALEKVRDNYHREGIIHDSLSPDKVLVTIEKALVGHSVKPQPKIWGYAETFLFFGDEVDSSLKVRLQTAKDDLFANEHLYPPAARRLSLPDLSWHQHSFGAMLYQYITKEKPQGVYTKICDFDPSLDPWFDGLITKCLSASYSSMQEVVDAFKALSAKQSEVAPTMRRIREQPIPEGMALILLEDKLELGCNDGHPNETPLFRAKVKPFFIDILPVTCATFEQFLSSWTRSSYSRDDNAPATLVSWMMAKAFCRWRSEQEGLDPDTYRLPSEYEWEAAARGITGEQYPWGKNFDSDRCHCGYDKEVGTVPVKKHPPGRFGLYSMLGNAWEWTESPYQAHPFSTHNEKGYGSDARVVKGGCWLTPEKECRASLRAAFSPNEARGNIGFRCVKSAQN